MLRHHCARVHHDELQVGLLERLELADEGGAALDAIHKLGAHLGGRAANGAEI